ncbi:hypothetical protein PAXRUDRAFT_19639 [Paxillus rubicundulus Ve08.2h10]|uniref:Uncharacterized protein n=1 Tax=Paxillus rubicundulus Ve08.2h10 TaxID=930991 RepID=A0A0D0CU94_9AGAM|nr:hypothetical protein PAXRUDRAFT_19639 [Paxillus rubicundulus Ve08.2h10]
MPALRPQLRRSQRLKITSSMAKNTPAPPPSSSSRGNMDQGRRGRGRGRGRGSAGSEAESSSGFRVHWETAIGPGRTSKMVQWLVDHPVDCIQQARDLWGYRKDRL